MGTIWDVDRAARILIVEDDAHVARALREGLEDRGYAVLVAGSAAAAHAALDGLSPGLPDAIILDLLLPDADGLVLCGDLKARADVPLVVCSALPAQPNAVLSERLGADAFLSKPFDLDELEAVIAELLERPRPAEADRVGLGRPAAPGSGPVERAERAERAVGDLVVHHSQRQVTLRDVPLPLTPTEYKLLLVLVGRPGDAYSREEIGQEVWGGYDAAIGRSIDVHVAHLRSKIAAAARGAPPGTVVPAIGAVRGFGFRMLTGPGVETAALGRR